MDRLMLDAMLGIAPDNPVLEMLVALVSALGAVGIVLVLFLLSLWFVQGKE